MRQTIKRRLAKTIAFLLLLGAGGFIGPLTEDWAQSWERKVLMVLAAGFIGLIAAAVYNHAEKKWPQLQ